MDYPRGVRPMRLKAELKLAYDNGYRDGAAKVILDDLDNMRQQITEEQE